MRNVKVHKIQEGKAGYLGRQVSKSELENRKGERTNPLCYREEILW